MAIITDGSASSGLQIDSTSKAGRVTEYDPTGRAVALESKATFFASGSFTPAATPTDLVTIFGSASKTVRVLSLKIGTTNTAAGSQEFTLLKRSSANSGGTFVNATAVQADSADAASSATVGHYTANPASLGTLVGNINVKRVASPVAKPATFAGIVQDATYEMLDFGNYPLKKNVVLNGTGQGLCLNFAGAALVAGQTHYWAAVWTEE